MHYSIRSTVHGIRSSLKRLFLGLAGATFTSAFVIAGGQVGAAPPAFTLQPFVYDPANACPGIQATWDGSTGNPAPSILLTKPCTTATVAASGVDIVTPLEGQAVGNLTELNYDYKTGEHCGAGAPRFNLQLSADGSQNAFLGCVYGTQTDLGNGWTHVEYNAAQIQTWVAAAGGNPTSTLYDLYIIFDEGTDTPVGGTIGTAGLIHIDNISVNGQVIGSPTSPMTKDDCKNNGWKTLVGANGGTFKNQGDCVSYVATKGKNLPAGAPASSTPGATTMGDVVLDNPTQTLSFAGTDNGASITDTGTASYSNPSASLSYTAPLTCVNVSGNTAYFAYVIPAGNAYSGTWVVWKVVDNSPDEAGFTTAADEASANALCEAGSAAVTNYPITSGDIVVNP